MFVSKYLKNKTQVNPLFSISAFTFVSNTNNLLVLLSCGHLWSSQILPFLVGPQEILLRRTCKTIYNSAPKQQKNVDIKREYKRRFEAVRNTPIKLCPYLTNVMALSSIETKETLLRNAGDTRMCEWIVSTFGLTIDDVQLDSNFVLRFACKGGHLDMCKWLVATVNLTIEDARSWDNYALKMACCKGRLDICKWLVSTFKLTIHDACTDNNYALKMAYINGHLDICKWFAITFGVTIDDII